MSDVRDILELEQLGTPEISKHAIMGIRKESVNIKKKKDKDSISKRPEGMHRELYALLYSSDGNKDLPPLLPTDSDKGYKSNKAKLGMKRVRPWSWMGFANPARKDSAVLHHWRRTCDEGKTYPFAMFNKKIDILIYTSAEYNKHLSNGEWNKAETDHLFDLCQQFDLRWPVIEAKWLFSFDPKSIEDLKERYYEVTNCLKKIRGMMGSDGKMVHYDADHERRRKEQLKKLLDRTPEQYEEEQQLLAEMRKIESRKKEREKKTQDLQKLISAADSTVAESKKLKSTKKKTSNKVTRSENNINLNIENCSGIKFSDVRPSGVSLRSQKMKLPASVGQRKVKAVEQLLVELGVDQNPSPTEVTSTMFNDLRSNLVLMYEFQALIVNTVFEMQTLKHQYETLMPGQTLDIPNSLLRSFEESPTKPKGISEVIDHVASPSTPNRKRKAALEQGNVLKKIKQRT